MHDKLRHVTTIIWDFDNTLYHMDGDSEEMWHMAAARIALDHGFTADIDAALLLARQSYDRTRSSTTYLVEDHGITLNDVHHMIHARVDASGLVKCIDTCAAFAALPHIRHGILSHGSRDWVLRGRDRLGLEAYIPDDAVMGLEDYGYEKKSVSLKGLEEVMGRLNARPAASLFVEDQADNLKLAADRLEMTTALLHHGHAPEVVPAHVHILERDAPSLLRHLVHIASKT